MTRPADVHAVLAVWPGWPGLVLDGTVAGGAEALLFRVRRGPGERYVLKLGAPARVAEEYRALRALHGPSLVRPVAWWEPTGALLLEAVEPGMPLAEEADEETAFRVWASVASGFSSPSVAGPFSTLADWVRALGPFEAGLRQRGDPRLPRVTHARRMAEKLVRTQVVRRLLHGDLHGGNILRAGGGPLRRRGSEGSMGRPGL